MPAWRDWESAPDSQWALALEREPVIRPLAERLRVTAKAAEEAASTLGISRTLVYDLIRRFKQRPQTSSLLPFKRGRSTHSRFLTPEREALLAAVIREFYLKPERPSLAALFQEVRQRFAENDLPAPHYRTLRRRVAALPPELVARKREGAKAAREKLGAVHLSSLRPEEPLEIVQIDHTRADVMVVDQEHRLPMGRPHLSLAIDVATRLVLGFNISTRHPSALSVSLVLTHAVLPKAQWLADRELQTLDWPAGGLPHTVHVDNAKEFHSAALIRGCEEHGILIKYRPRQHAHFGGHIERLIGTMMGAVHLLPGTTSSNVHEKASYDAEGRAVLTMPELERWLALQIAGVYHITKHSALGKTPLEAWQEGMARRRSAPHYPLDADEFFLDFLPAVPRLIERDGIHFHKILYWSSVLSPWAGRRKEPMLVKYDPRDISRVYVREPGGRHWAIPYANLGQPPISLWELQDARKRLNASASRAPNEHSLFANILEQRRIVREATRKSRQRRQAEETPLETPSAPSAPEEVVSPAEELKPFPVEYWRKDL
jgi:putative transposase